MAKVKLTKNELKTQKNQLKRFQRYLPTLQLKKQQLQMVIRQVDARVAQMQEERKRVYDSLRTWIAVFGEDMPIDNLVSVKTVETSTGNIAGIDIPVFERVEFDDVPYDLYYFPLWVDAGIDAIKRLTAVDAEIQVLERQRDLLDEELRITTQRVNLFEKVKIPETKENIRMIRIYLGDQQTAEVVRGKIAKNKLGA